MRPAALADPLCGSLCDLCGECFSEQFHHRGTENHRGCTEKSLTQLAPIYFFSNLLKELQTKFKKFQVMNVSSVPGLRSSLSRGRTNYPIPSPNEKLGPRGR